MIKAVIFDMDGVIIDSEYLNSLAWEKLLKQLGKTPQYNEVGLIHTVGTGPDEYIAIIDKYKIKEELRKRRREIYGELLKSQKLLPMDGFLQVIKIIHESNLKTAVASNRVLHLTELTLTRLNVRDFFEHVICPDELTRHKPHPDLYLRAAKKLKVKPQHCLVVEDSEIGVTAGLAAGMKVVAVPNKYTKHLDFSNAHLVIPSLKNLKREMISSL